MRSLTFPRRVAAAFVRFVGSSAMRLRRQAQAHLPTIAAPIEDATNSLYPTTHSPVRYTSYFLFAATPPLPTHG
ncbi:hypothetical protein EDB83DRAFT_1588280 [Lactarius deliciosus]|nr:hypothetical protein EDB83DRAFT_1588280 [Lactarius deliciosus]